MPVPSSCAQERVTILGDLGISLSLVSRKSLFTVTHRDVLNRIPDMVDWASNNEPGTPLYTRLSDRGTCTRVYIRRCAVPPSETEISATKLESLEYILSVYRGDRPSSKPGLVG